MKVGGQRVSYLSVSQFHQLDLACTRLSQAFGDCPYLVGSVAERADWRDVDVRQIVDDDEYAHLTRDQWTMFGFSVSAWLSAQTGGLPIDFQFQQMTAANELHAGKRRNPLGLRSLYSFRGDAAPGRPPAACPTCGSDRAHVMDAGCGAGDTPDPWHRAAMLREAAGAWDAEMGDAEGEEHADA